MELQMLRKPTDSPGGEVVNSALIEEHCLDSRTHFRVCEGPL
jgi:hypothetical protein